MNILYFIDIVYYYYYMNDNIWFKINSRLIAIIDFEVNKFFMKHSYIINQLNVIILLIFI